MLGSAREALFNGVTPHAMLLVLALITSTTLRSTKAAGIPLDPVIGAYTNVNYTAQYLATQFLTLDHVVMSNGGSITVEIGSYLGSASIIKVALNNVALLDGASFTILCSASYLAEGVKIFITVDQLYVKNGAVAFTGTFPPSTLLTVTNSVFTATTPEISSWTSFPLYSLLSLFGMDDKYPLLAFVATAFQSDSIVILDSNVFSFSSPTSNAVTAVGIVGNLVLNDGAYFGIRGFSVSASTTLGGSGLAFAICQGASLVVTNRSMFHIAEGSIGRYTMNGFIFGTVDVSNSSVLMVERVDAVSSLTSFGVPLEFRATVSVLFGSTLWLSEFVNMPSAAASDVPLVQLSDTLYVTNGSQIVVKNCYSASLGLIDAWLVLTDEASHIFTQCNFIDSGSYLITAGDYSAAGVMVTEDYPCGSCHTNTACTIASYDARFVSPGLCACNCSPGTYGDKCFSTNVPPRTSRFLFDLGLTSLGVFPELNAPHMSLLSAAAAVTIRGLHLGASTNPSSSLVFDLCRRAHIRASPFPTADASQDFAYQLAIADVHVVNGSLLGILSCGSDTQTRDPTSAFQMPPLRANLTGLVMYQSSVLFAGQFPPGTLVSVVSTSWDAGPVGPPPPSSGSGGSSLGGGGGSGGVVCPELYYGGAIHSFVVLCYFGLADGSALVIRDALVVRGSADHVAFLYSAAGAVVTTSSQLIVRNVSIPSFATRCLVYWDAYVSRGDQIVVNDRSLLVFSDLVVSDLSDHALLFTNIPLVVDSYSALILDGLFPGVARVTPLQLEANVTITASSWLLLRSMQLRNVSRSIVNCTGLWTMRASTMSWAYLDLEGSASPAALLTTQQAFDFFDTEFLTRCVTYNAVPFNSSASPTALSGMFEHRQDTPCNGECQAFSGCQPYLTASAGRGCTCNCTGSGHGIACLPTALVPSAGDLNPDPGSIVVPQVLSSNLNVSVAYSMDLYGIDVKNSATFELQLDTPSSERAYTIRCSNWIMRLGTALVLRGSLNGSFAHSLDSVTITIDQLYCNGCKIAFLWHMPPNARITVSNSMFTSTADVLWDLPYTSYFDGYTFNPFLAFFDLTAHPQSSIRLFNLLMLPGTAVVNASSMIAFVGSTVLIESEFVLEGFSMASSVSQTNGTLLTVSYGKGNASMPTKRPNLNVPSFAVALGVTTPLLALLNRSVFRIAHGTTPVVAGEALLFGAVVLYNQSALLVQQVGFDGAQGPALRFSRGLFLGARSWVSIRSVIHAAELFSLDSGVLGLANDSAISLNGNLGLSAVFVKLGVGMTISNITVSGTIAARCNQVNGGAAQLTLANYTAAGIPVPAEAFVTCSNGTTATSGSCGSVVTECSATDSGVTFDSDLCQCRCSTDAVGRQCVPWDSQRTTSIFSFTNENAGVVLAVSLLYVAPAFTGMVLTAVSLQATMFWFSPCAWFNLWDSFLEDRPPAHVLKLHRLTFTQSSRLQISSCQVPLATYASVIPVTTTSMAPMVVTVDECSFTNTLVYLYGFIPSSSLLQLTNNFHTSTAATQITCGSLTRALVIVCKMCLQDGAQLLFSNVTVGPMHSTAIAVVAVGQGLIARNHSAFVAKTFTLLSSSIPVPFLLVLAPTTAPISPGGAYDGSVIVVSGVSYSTTAPMVQWNASLDIANFSVLVLDNLAAVSPTSPGPLVELGPRSTRIVNQSLVLLRNLRQQNDYEYLRVRGTLLVANASYVSFDDTLSNGKGGVAPSLFVAPNASVRFDASSTLAFKCHRNYSGRFDGVPPTLSGAVVLPPRIVTGECDGCDLAISCFEPFAIAVPRRQCMCDCVEGSGFGSLCLPVDIATLPTSGTVSDVGIVVPPGDGATQTQTYYLPPFVYENQVVTDDIIVPTALSVYFRNVTFTNGSIVWVNLTDLGSVNGSETVQVVFEDCVLLDAVLYLAGYSFYGDAPPGALVSELPRSDSALEVILDRVNISAGSTVLFEGLLPVGIAVTLRNIWADDKVESFWRSSILYPLMGTSFIRPSLHLFGVALIRANVSLQNCTFLSGLDYSHESVVLESSLFLNESVLLVRNSNFATHSHPSINLACTLRVQFGSVFAVVRSKFNTTNAAVGFSGYGYWTLDAYSMLVMSESFVTSTAFSVGTLYMSGESRIWIERVVAEEVLVSGSINSWFDKSHVVVTETSSSLFFTGGGLFMYKPNETVVLRCLTWRNPTTSELVPLTNASQFYLAGIPWLGGGDPLPCGVCNVKAECFSRFAIALDRSTCKCQCFGFEDGVLLDPRVCYLRPMPWLGVTAPNISLYSIPSSNYSVVVPPPPPGSYAMCDVIDALPGGADVQGSAPSSPWYWEVVFQGGAVEAVDGVSFNGVPCDLWTDPGSSFFVQRATHPSYALGGDTFAFDALACGSNPPLLQLLRRNYNLSSGYLNVTANTSAFVFFFTVDYLAVNSLPPALISHAGVNTSARVFKTLSRQGDIVFASHGVEARIESERVVTGANSGFSKSSSVVVSSLDSSFADTQFLLFPPKVTSVSGCFGDAFPSTFNCPSDGSAIITIVGEDFPPNVQNITFEFYANQSDIPGNVLPVTRRSLATATFDTDVMVAPRPPPNGTVVASCRNWTYVSPQEIHCTSYAGLGDGGIVTVTTPLYGTYRFPEVTVSFIADLSFLCPVSTVTGTVCGDHGVCNVNFGVCECENSVSVGFWEGSACDRCAPAYNGSEGSDCLVPCPVDEFNNICGGFGVCSAGWCICGGTAVPKPCNVSCPGVNGPCSQHGTCNLATGTCDCFSDAVNGFYDGASCDVCMPEYSGSACLTPCPIGPNSLPCSGNGTCFNGVCYCTTGSCGSDCSLAASNGTACGACPRKSQYGFGCSFTCPGSPNPDDVCNGHGACDNGIYGSGACRCNVGYGGPSCSVVCASDAFGLLCSGHGSCDASTGTCRCDRNYGNSRCGSRCESSNGIICGGHGTCDEGSANTGKCICTSGYSGASCNSSCLFSSPPCSGHGVCLDGGNCSCFASSSTGYWGGTTCSVCAEFWVGVSCNLQCPVGPTGIPCNGRGFCTNLLTCQCYQSPSTGYWSGSVCDTCMYGYAGRYCNLTCDGGWCSPCNGRGICSAINGSCACFADTSRGFWDAAGACAGCVAGYYGGQCNLRCPNCSQGVCFDGISGNGTCGCFANYTLNASGVCGECAAGRYGPRCVLCPSCSGHGVCRSGIAGNGTCLCDVGFALADCSAQCNISSVDGNLCGNGTCVATGQCSCRANFTLDEMRTCSKCKTGNYGPACNLTCPKCVFGTCLRNGTCQCNFGYWGTWCNQTCPGGAVTPCNLHGTCSAVTGACTCYQDTVRGYYTGAACTACEPSYLSTGCTIPCPTDPVLGVCSKRGTCWNGTCYNCSATPADATTVFLVCGVACNTTNELCISPTFSCPSGFWGFPNCTTHCPGFAAVGGNGTSFTACSTRGFCDPVGGTCFCFPGAYGVACDQSCPQGFSTLHNGTFPCTANGICLATGTCKCFTGFWGGACQLQCPGGSLKPCSGRGTCQVDGSCLCQYGAHGSACEKECGGGFSNPCSGSGLCSPSGACSCFGDAVRGFWTGANCSNCAPGYAGSSCTLPCIVGRGVVVNRACVCAPGFIGDDCSLACPKPGAGEVGALLTCAGLGTCVVVRSGSSMSASCKCNENYYGPTCQTLCTPALCRNTQNLYRPQCNPTSGACECETSPGIWSGDKCDSCAPSRWGSECNIPCSCNGNGVCSSTDGSCQCYRDAIHGYWKGDFCDTCAANYIGANCTVHNIVLAAQDDAVSLSAVSDTTAFLQSPSFCSLLDPDTRLLFSVANDVFVAIVNFTTSAVIATVDVGGVPIDCTFFNSTVVSVASQGSDGIVSTVYISTKTLAPVSVHLPPFTTTTNRKMRVQAAVAPPVLLRTVSNSGFSCDLYGDSATLNATSVQCVLSSGSSATTAVDNSNGTVGVEVQWVGIVLLPLLDSVSDRWHLIISTKAADLWMYNLQRNVVTVRPLRVPDYSGAPIAVVAQLCSTSVSDIDAMYCTGFAATAADSSLRDVLIAAVRVSTHSVWAMTTVQTSVSALNAITAFGVDAAYGLALVAYNLPNTASTLLTIRVISWNSTLGHEEVSLVGSQGLPTLSIALALSIESGGRTLVVVTLRIESILILRFNMFGIATVRPTVVDSSGGATITVIGDGFPVGGNFTTYCITGGVKTLATVLNSTTATCAVLRSTRDAGACALEFIDIVLGNGTSNTQTAGVYRPSPAQLTSVSTNGGAVVGIGSARYSLSLTIQGYGFVASEVATCRLVNRSTRAELFRSPATVRSGSMVTCTQPVTVPSAEATCIEYSHDGFFFGTSCATYQVAGDLGSVRVLIGGQVVPTVEGALTTRAAGTTQIPAFSVATADVYGNLRSVFEDTASLRIRCSTLLPTIAIGNRVAELLQFSQNTTLQPLVVAGLASFAACYLVSPTIGVFPLHCFASVDATMATELQLTVLAGVPASIRVVVQSSWYIGVTMKNTLLPNPMVWLLDSAGNTISASAGLPSQVFLSYSLYDDVRQAAVPTLLSTFPRGDGSYIFENVQVHTLFGQDTPLSFFAPQILAAVVTVRTETCLSATERAVVDSTTCAPCPDHGICDGTTNVLVQSGYWRANINAFTYYACTPASACPSTGQGCAAGYENTLCSACSEGYGWSVNFCAPCYSHATNRGLIVLLIAGFTVIVYYLSVVGMPITAHVDTLFQGKITAKSPAAVLVKLLVSHFQMVTLIPYSRLGLPAWFKQVFLIAQSGSTINPNLSFISCEIGGGLLTSAIAVVVLCPIMISLMGILCLIAAKWTAYRLTQTVYKELVLEETNLLHKKNIRNQAEFVAQGDEELRDEVAKAHNQLLDDEADCPPAASAAGIDEGKEGGPQGEGTQPSDVVLEDDDQEQAHEAEEAVHTGPSAKEQLNHSRQVFWQRWVNMMSVSTVVIFFIMFPTLIEYSASLLNCIPIDYGGGVSRDVVSGQPSVECSGPTYEGIQRAAWTIVFCVGVGVPALNYGFVKFLQRFTCDGNIHVARDVFFFATGGYRQEMWFWESVSLGRKAFLVLGATLMKSIQLKVLWCLWILMISVWLNITLKPWRSPILVNVELCSLVVLAFTFGCGEILALAESYDAYVSNAVVIALILANGFAIFVFLSSIAWVLKEKGVEMILGGDSALSSLVVNNNRRLIRVRRREISSYLEALGGLHPRFCALSELELLVQRIEEEVTERKRLTASSLGLPEAESSSAQSRLAPKIVQGEVYMDRHPRQRKDATPQVIQRYALNANRAALASKLLKPEHESAAQNPLLSTFSSNDGMPSRFTSLIGEMLMKQNDPRRSADGGSGEGSDDVGVESGGMRAGVEGRLQDAFADMWEMWAYWTSLAMNSTQNADRDEILERLVTIRLDEMYSLEKTLLSAVYDAVLMSKE